MPNKKQQPDYLKNPQGDQPNWDAFDSFVTTPPPEAKHEGAGVLRTAGDMAIKGAQGVVDLGSAAVGLGSLATGGLVGEGMRSIGYDPKRTNEFLGEYLSDDQKASDAAVQGEDSFLGAAAAAVTHPRALAGSIVESLPGMIGGMGVTGAIAERIATRAALATAEGAAASAAELAAGKSAAQAAQAARATAAGKQAADAAVKAAETKLLAIGSGTEGAQSAGQIADDAQAAGRTYGQYAPAAVAAGLGTAGIGLGAGKLMGDAATDFATGARTLKGSKAAKIGKEFVSEGVLEEMPQSAQEQVFTNIAQGEDDIGKGVANAAGSGLVTGGVMGAGMGMLHGDHGAPAPVPLANTGPLSRAANAVQAAATAQAAASAPAAAASAPAAAQSALPSIAQIDARMAELVAIGQGSLASSTTDAAGNKVKVPGVPGRRLTHEEITEYNSLEAARRQRAAIPADQQAEFTALLAAEEAENNKKFEPAKLAAEQARAEAEARRAAAEEAQQQAAQKARDDAEHAQIASMVNADEQLRQQTAKVRQQQDLDDIATRVARDNAARAEVNRAGLRDDVLADDSIPADGKKSAFAAALKREGYRSTELTEADHHEIDAATAPVPSLPNELVDAVPERKASAPAAAPGAPNTDAVDAAIAAGMRLKTANGAVLHKPGSSKIFKLSTAQRAHYLERMATPAAAPAPAAPNVAEADDALYAEAEAFVRTTNDASAAKLQQQFKIGYNRAQRLLEKMHAAGLVSPMTSAGARTVTAPAPADAQPSAAAQAFDAAAQQAATSPQNDLPEPTAAQKEAGNYKVGRAKLHGLDLSIENPAGSTRKGVDKSGTPWETTMQHHYGYIRGTVGADKDHIDTFIGKNLDSDKVFVVDQIHPDSGKFDEHKVMLGFNSLEEARAAYQANYDANWTGGRAITETTVDGFKSWLASGKTKKPFAAPRNSAAAPTAPAAAAAPSAPQLTKIELNKMTVKDMTNDQLLQAKEVFKGQSREPKIDREIAARDIAPAADRIVADELVVPKQAAPDARERARTLADLAANAGHAVDIDGHFKPGVYGTAEQPLKFVSGMTAPGDFTRLFSNGKNVGISMLELSKVSVPRIAEQLAKAEGAHLFVDSGAFSIHMSNVREKEAAERELREVAEAAKLDHAALFDRYEDLSRAISVASDGTANGRALFVMPDIVGDQAGSLALVQRYASEINSYGASAIVPLQGGELTLTQAYEQMMRHLGMDPAGDISPLIGIPSQAEAVSNDEFTDLLRKHGDRIHGVHILGALSDQRLQPRLNAMIAAGYDFNVSADANRVRSLTSKSRPRKEAVKAVLNSDTADGAPMPRVVRDDQRPEPAEPVSALKQRARAAETVEPNEPAQLGVHANATAPEHVVLGVDDRELGQVVEEFNDAQAEMMQGAHAISNIFQPPTKREVVRLEDKARATGKLWDKKEVQAYNKNLAAREVLEKENQPIPAELAKVIADFEAVYLPHAARLEKEAKAEIGKWKNHAQAQGDDPATRRANGRKIVLSLFDLSGEWSRPWEEAGYQVYRFDIQDDPTVGDVNNFSSEFFGDWFGDFDGLDIHAVLAATPCTDFAVSGARHFAAKDKDGRTVSSVKLVHQTLRVIEYFKPSVWAIENPVGRIEKLGGLPPWRLSFDPNHLGDSYTKKTLLWGRFNADLPVAPVEPTEGSKMHRLYGGKSMATKNARSETPKGFSYGFFMANNVADHPAMALANKFDRLDRALIEQAMAAGVTEEQITEAVEDYYYMDQDDDAANAAVRDLIAEAAPDPEPAPTKPKARQEPAKKKGTKQASAPQPAPATAMAAAKSGQDFGQKARDVVNMLPQITTFEQVATAENLLFDLAYEMERAKDQLAPQVRAAADSVRVFKMINTGDKSYAREGEGVRRTLENVLEQHPPAAKVEENAPAKVNLGSAATGSVLNAEDGTLYRIEGIDIGANKIRTTRNPDMGSERVVLMDQGRYDRLAAEDASVREASVKAADSVRKTTPAAQPAADLTGLDQRIAEVEQHLATTRQSQKDAEKNGNAWTWDKKVAEWEKTLAAYQEARERLLNPPPPSQFAGNKLFTSDAVEKARARMKSKLSQLNSGMDPELMMDGITIAGAYIESGVRSFAAFSKAMVGDLGEAVRPYLRSFYEGVRHYPGLDAAGMNSSAEIDAMEQANTAPHTQASPIKNDAIGETVKAKPSRAKAPADTLLRDDWGVSHIDGYAELPGGANEQTDYGLRGGLKDAFLKDAQNYLRKVSLELQAQGFVPYTADNGKPLKVVSVNESGTAGSGDISLYAYHPEKQHGIYLHIGDTAIRGMVPTTKSGIALMMRVGHTGDRTGTQDHNRWMPVNLSAVDLAEQAAKAVHAAALARSRVAQSPTINHTETIPAPVAEPKEQNNDSTPAASAPAIDSPVAEGQRPAGSHAVTRGAEQPRAGAGRDDARSVRERGGRDQVADDAREDLGDRPGDDAVPDRAPDAVAGHSKSVSADFRPDLGGLTREGSWFDTAKRNIDLIELALKIESEGRPATAAEQAQLAKYVGFGASAIRNKLFPIPPSYAKQQDPNRLIWPSLIGEASWRALAERMEALPAAWQRSVLQSSQYAHYTSEGIIRSAWSAMQRLGFTGGKVFEPGMGIGSFSMLMPDAVRKTSRYTGVEFDGPTALIARLLSPEQNMLHDDFIKRKFPKDYFDVAIGNPPFSQTQIFADPDYEKHGFMLHDFFFAKSIDRVRPGGLLAFVTSKGTMDKQTDKARKYLAARADLVGAIRLPSTAFEDNAGTSVVTDVIFLRKRLEDEAPAGAAWANVATVDTKDGPVVINEYFAKHPEMVLGQNRISGGADDMGRRINSNGRGAAQYTVVSYDQTPAELDAKFAAAVERLPQNVYSVLGQSTESVQRETAKVDFDPSVKREGVVYQAKDGAIMRVEHGVGVPLASGMKMTESDKAWFASYIGLRDLVNEARLAQATDGKWESSLKKLNKAYDAFRKEHGPINDFRVQVRKSTDEDGKEVETESRIFKNRRRFREDYDAAILTQLETINEAGDIVKSAFLQGRTIGKPITREIKTVGDALAVSLDETGRLNLADVGRRIGLNREETIEALGNQVFQAPAGDWQLADEYLSGDVVSKLEEAEQAARLDESLYRNVEALKAVQPEKLGPSQISAKLGASWIPEAHVNEFAGEIDAGAVTFDPKTETWQVDGGNLRSQRRAGAEYGTAARSPSELLESALNSRSVKILHGKGAGELAGKTDQEATTAANEMLKKIKDKFKGWVWTDAERASELVESYNRRYNNIAPRRFDGSHLTLPGVSLRYTLHPHQKNGIWRQVQTGDTYLAHAVGAGKTIEMIAGGMEQKRLGLIKKPMYVVPNHMLEQFSNEFMELYPLANIMVADDENFSAERRKAFIANATLNNPDAVIITHDAFQRIGVKEESVAPIRDEILADLEIELSETAKDNGARVRRSQLEQQIEAVTQRFDRIISAGGKDSTLKFEDIGVDFIFADEAHVFRKLDFHTSQQIKGIDPNGSKRALDMYVKTRWLQQQRPGRAMVFASGTPVTNTMGELYTIMRFFAPKEMDRAGISTFDAWARQFGEVAPALEPNAAGKYELIERFAKFDNVPELMSRVRQFMDVLTSEHLGALVKRPDLIGGKPNLNIVQPSAALEHYMKTVLGPRIEISKKWKPTKDEPSNPDPIVSIITDGRFAAIDPRFFGGELGEEGSIITEMGDKVAAAYHAGKNNVYQDKNGKDEPIKGSTQIVFYNMGFGEQSQKNRGFNARAAFTKRLTDGGIPRDQIAWFDDANTDAKKEAVFKDMRSGKLRVLIGSAKKMGTGVNVQKRLAVLHYQDPPWFPADVEQPHGRIIRQGNQNGEVAIEWYTTKGTYQSTMWQMVGRKQRFIDQAFSGDKSLRSMEDMGEASLFEQAAAVASGDPRAIQLAGLKQEVERFERLQAAHASEQINVRSALRSAEWQVESAQKRIVSYGAAFKAIGERFYSFTSGKVGNRLFDKIGEFGQAIKDAFNEVAADAVLGGPVQDRQIATLDTLPITVDSEFDKTGKNPSGELSLYVNVGSQALHISTAPAFGADVDAVGLGRRMVNSVNGISSDLSRAKSDLASGQTDLVRLRKKQGAPFEYQQEMAEKYGDLKRLEEELRLEGLAKDEPALPIVINADGSSTEDSAASAGEQGQELAFSRARIDSDDPLVNIFSKIAQDDAAFRLPTSTGKTLSAVMADMAGLSVNEFYGAGVEEDPKMPVDRVWEVSAPSGEHAWVYRNNKNKEIWLDISNWKEGKLGAEVYQAVATFAKNTGHTFIGDPQGLSDKALYRRTEHMISSALRHGTTEHLAPHSRQREDIATATGTPMRPIQWREGDHGHNLREMLVSSYTNILQVFPEIADVQYNFANNRFERVSPVRSSADELLADESAAGEHAAGARTGSGDARGAVGRGSDGANEGDGQLGRVDAVAFTDTDFKAVAQSVRDAYDALFPSRRGAFTPPLGVSDLKRAALVGTVLREEGSGAGRATLDHVSNRLLQRVSPQLDSVLYSRDAEYFRDDGNFLPAMPAGVDVGAAAPLELSGRELLDAKKSTEQLNRQLAKAGMEPVRALRVAPNANFALARQIGEALGITVNFVSRNPEFEGVAYDGIAYLADGMRNAELAIAGHETLHALEQGNPELGAKLRTQIRAYLKDGVVEDRQAREYAANGLQDVSVEQAEAEVIADINGAMWMDPVFWADLAKADRSLFRSVAYKFMEVAAKAIKSLRGSRFDVSALVRDVEAVRAIMVATWAEHGASRDAAEQAKPAVFSTSNLSVPLLLQDRLTDTAIAEEVEKRIGQFAHQPAIRIRDSAVGELPDATSDDRVAGAVHDGAIYLFRDQLPTRMAVQRTLFHELFHYGLRRFLTKDEYITHMLDLAGRDADVDRDARRWAETPDGRRAAAYGGEDYAHARGVDELLAQIAETNAGVFLDQSVQARVLRTVQGWLASLAQAFGMKATAAYLRGMKSDEARSTIRSMFAKLEQDAPASVEPWGPAADTAFRRDGVTATPAFKAWFGDSKVVDADGKPLVVYHGTNKDISKFKGSHIWVTDEAELANEFVAGGRRKMGDKPGRGSAVYPVYAAIQNPVDLRGLDLASDVTVPEILKRAGIAPTDAILEKIARESLDSGYAGVSASLGDPVQYLVEKYKAGSRLSNLLDNPALKSALEAGGIDGIHLTEKYTKGTRKAPISAQADTYAAFHPAQIKSATGNNGEFDPGNAGIAFSRAGLGETLASAANNVAALRLPAGYLVGDLFNQSGKLSWWHKTIGTMENLAKRRPAFARVYAAVQSFLGDVSRYAVQSADLAPTLLPKLEDIADIIGKNRKKPLTGEDTKAIGGPIFEGTLVWARDANDEPVKIAELETWADTLTAGQKAQILLQKGIIDDAQHRSWLNSPLNLYEATINVRFKATQLKAGVVWSDAELRRLFNLNDAQIGLYREFRAAIDKSLTSLTISEMIKLGGKDAKSMLDQAMAAPDLASAAELLRDHFIELARMDPERTDMHLDTAKQIMNLADKGEDLMDRGYAPLSRFGKYTVYVQDVNEDGEAEQVYFGMFETQHEASRMARQMAAEHPQAQVSHGTVSEDAYKLFAGVSPETIELFGSMVGLDSQADPATSEVYQAYLKLAKNNRSAMKRMIQRKGIAGFSEDAGRVLAGFIYSNARLTAGNAHLGEIDEAITEIPKQQGELTDAAMQLREHIRNPEGGGSKLGGLMFAQFLGGSVASAMVNLTQPFTMTLPYLSQWGGLAKAGTRLGAAIKDAGKKETGDAGLDAALRWASDEGIVAPQEVHYLQAQAAGKGSLQSGDGTPAGNARAHLNNAMTKVSLGWGKLFAMAELANRRVTFIAAYRTAVAEGIANPAEFAREAVSQTQGTYNSGNKPKWARGAIGGLLLTFKQYSVGYLELLSRMAFAGEPGSPERAAGRRAALYMLAVLVLMSGADGLPFEQDLEDAIDGLMQRLGYNFSSKRKKQEILTDVLGQGGADFALKGISSMPGMPVDVAGRFGMGNLLPGTGLLTKKASYTSDLGELAGPAGDLVKRAFLASGKALGGDLAGAALDISPASVRNVAKGADMLATGAYHDARGYKVNDTTGLEGIMKIVGFQPNSTSNIQDAKGQALDMIQQNRLRSSEITEHWAQGLANGDTAMVAEAREQRDDWNKKNPDTPIRVNMPAVIQRVRAMKQDAINRTQKTAPAALKASVRNELAEVRG
jgi:N12 class adenine-specific DNA methylase/tRNA1(Val) A37 N6-methylase TrmN6